MPTEGLTTSTHHLGILRLLSFVFHLGCPFEVYSRLLLVDFHVLLLQSCHFLSVYSIIGSASWIEAPGRTGLFYGFPQATALSWMDRIACFSNPLNNPLGHFSGFLQGRGHGHGSSRVNGTFV